MRLEVGCVDHDRLPIRSLGSQPHNDPGKHVHVAPPLTAVVERLGWAILLWCVAPAQAIAIDENNATQNTPVIDPWLAMALRKVRSERCHLFVVQPKKIAHHAP